MAVVGVWRKRNTVRVDKTSPYTQAYGGSVYLAHRRWWQRVGSITLKEADKLPKSPDSYLYAQIAYDLQTSYSSASCVVQLDV